MKQEDYDAIETFRALPTGLQNQVQNQIEHSISHLREVKHNDIDPGSLPYDHYNQVWPGINHLLKALSTNLQNKPESISFLNDNLHHINQQQEQKQQKQQEKKEKEEGQYISYSNQNNTENNKESTVNYKKEDKKNKKTDFSSQINDILVNRSNSDFIKPETLTQKNENNRDIFHDLLDAGERKQNDEKLDSENENQSQEKLLQQYHENLLHTSMMQYFGPNYERREHLSLMNHYINQTLKFYHRSQSSLGKRWLALLPRLETVVTGVSSPVIAQAAARVNTSNNDHGFEKNEDDDNDDPQLAALIHPSDIHKNIPVESSSSPWRVHHDKHKNKAKRSNKMRSLRQQLHELRVRKRKLEDMTRQRIASGMAAELIQRRCSKLQSDIRNKEQEIRRERRKRMSEQDALPISSSRENTQHDDPFGRGFPDTYSTAPSTWWRWSHAGLSSSAWPAGVPMASTTLTRSLRSILNASDPLDASHDSLPSSPTCIDMDRDARLRYMTSYPSQCWRRVSAWRSLAYNIPEHPSQRRHALRGYAHALASVSTRPRIAYEVLHTVVPVPTISPSDIHEHASHPLQKHHNSYRSKAKHKTLQPQLILRFAKLWKGGLGQLGAAIGRVVLRSIRRSRRLLRRYPEMIGSDIDALRSTRQVDNTKHTVHLLIREVACRFTESRHNNKYETSSRTSNKLLRLDKVKTAIRLACITELHANHYTIQSLLDSPPDASKIIRRAIIRGLSTALGRHWVQVQDHRSSTLDGFIDRRDSLLPLPSDTGDAQHLAQRIQRWVSKVSGEKPKEIYSVHVQWFIRWMLLRMLKQQQ